MDAPQSPLGLAQQLHDSLRGRVRARRNTTALANVGGNFLVVVRGVGCWTVVTSGERRGFYEEATDDPVQFMLACDPELLPVIFGSGEADLSAHMEDGSLMLEGNIDILERFLALPPGDDLLTLRSHAV